MAAKRSVAGLPTKRPRPICQVDGCTRVHRAKGLCSIHWWRKYSGRSLGGVERRKTKPGQVVMWISEHANHRDDGCLTFPFTRTGNDGRTASYLFNGKRVRATRIMCELAHGPAPTGMEAAHSCGKGHEGCIHPLHLRWATPIENNLDKVQHGTLLEGEGHHFAKLTAKQVQIILNSAGSNSDLARKFKVTPSNIAAIRSRRSWKSITRPAL